MYELVYSYEFIRAKFFTSTEYQDLRHKIPAHCYIEVEGPCDVKVD